MLTYMISCICMVILASAISAFSSSGFGSIPITFSDTKSSLEDKLSNDDAAILLKGRSLRH